MTAGRGGAPEEDRAPFDDVRDALRFALNAHQVSVPPSYMSRVMASAPGSAERRKKPTKAEREVMYYVGASSLDDLRALLKGKRLRSTSLVKRPPRPAVGLDGAHLAGFILRELGKLQEVHQTVLAGLCTNPVVPCSCGRRCCSGWEPVQRWVDAVDRTCEELKQRAVVNANPELVGPDGALRPGLRGHWKVGLSTQPALRRTLVKDYYRGDQKRSLIDLAAAHKVTDETVARHRGWIFEWLTERESKAWEEAAWWFDQVGITGAWL